MATSWEIDATTHVKDVRVVVEDGARPHVGVELRLRLRVEGLVEVLCHEQRDRNTSRKASATTLQATRVYSRQCLQKHCTASCMRSIRSSTYLHSEQSLRQLPARHSVQWSSLITAWTIQMIVGCTCTSNTHNPVHISILQ